MATEEAFVRSRSVHDGKDAFFLSCQEEFSEKKHTEKATCEQSQSINDEVNQDLQTDEDKGTPKSSMKDVKLLSEQVVDEVNQNQQEHEVKKQETKSTAEIEVVMISDQSRESTINEVAEENFGKANANESLTEQNKELSSIHILEASDKEILLAKAPVHVEGSSCAASATAAANVDCIYADFEESFSLIQNVDTCIQLSGKYTTEQVADVEGYDKPDEDPDAQEKNYGDDEEAASSTIQMGDVLELSKKAAIEEVDSGKTEVIGIVDEALVARNEEDMGSHEEDKSKQKDTEMQMTSEGHGDPYMTVKLQEENYQVNIPSHVTTDSEFSASEEVKTTEDGKSSGKSKTLNGSNMLEDDDKVNHESKKDSLENQEDYARVEESALEKGTVMVISEKDASATIFSRSIQDLEKSASAEMEEPSLQYEAYISKNGRFPADEDFKSNILVEKGEHETAIGSEETNDKLSNHPSDSTKEDIPEKIQRNDEVTVKEEAETVLELKYTLNNKGNENKVAVGSTLTDQVPLEPKDNYKVKSMIETAENQSDANDLQQDEMNTVKSSKSAQNEKHNAVDSESITETQSSHVIETLHSKPEALDEAETVEERSLLEKYDENRDNRTKRDDQYSDDIIKEEIEHSTPAKNEEVDEKRSEYPFEERKRNDEVTQINGTETTLEVQYTAMTRDENEKKTAGFIMTDQVPAEHEDETKEICNHETAENQSDANYLQHDQTKTKINTESAQIEEQKLSDLNSIAEKESSDVIRDTPYNQTEPSILAETVDECNLPEERSQTSDYPTKRDNEEPENEDKAKSIEKLPEKQDDINDLVHDEVEIEPENEDSIQELPEKQNDIISVQHEEMKIVACSKSVQSENENASNFVKTTEIERLDKMETPYSMSEATNVANTLEECGISEERSKSNTSGEYELPGRIQSEHVEANTTEADDAAKQLKLARQTKFQDVQEIRKNEMEAKETTWPNEVEEQLQQSVPVEERHKKTIQVTEETAVDQKPLPNETEKQLQKQFSELVLYEQMQKCSLLTEDIADESLERVQLLEEKNINYSILEQNKDETCLQEEVPRGPGVQILDFETSKSLNQKQAIEQEACRTYQEVTMQPRDFLYGNQCTILSPESEEIAVADTSIHTSLEESKYAEKSQATYNKEDRYTCIPVQINIAASDAADGKSEKACKEITDLDRERNCSSQQIHEPHDELNKSEETTDTNEKHTAKNSDITSDELNTKEGFKQCKVVVNEVRCDQIRKGHDVIAESNQEEKDREFTNQQVAGEYPLEEPRPSENVLLQSEEKSMESVERDSTRKHKGEDNLQVVSEEDASGRQETDESHANGDECAIQEKQVCAAEEGVDAEDPGSIAPTITDPAKATPKKSHNLLSGVGSKVKHSISKVKKAITGKPKNTSPKKAGEY